MKLHHISLVTIYKSFYINTGIITVMNTRTVEFKHFFISLPCLYTPSVNTLHMLTNTFVQYFLCIGDVALSPNTIVVIVVDTFVCWCQRGIYIYQYTFHAFTFIHLSRVQSLKFTCMYFLA